MPVAQFERDYGPFLDHNSGVGGEFVNQGKVSLGGWYVKVEVDCADGMLLWYGFIDEQADEQGGFSGTVASGRQTFVAYSMAQALAFEYMTRSRWYDEPNDVKRWSGSAISFNAMGRPNRSDAMILDDVADGLAKQPAHLFAPTAPANRRTDEFNAWTAAKYWSTRDVVGHLEQYAMPLNQVGGESIKFRIDGKNFLPNWDKPTIDTEGKSVLSVLQELINPSRLLQLSTLVDESTSPATVVLKIHSLSANQLNLPGGQVHLPNLDVLTIQAAAAQDTKIVIQSSESSTAHQIWMKGAKRQSVVTVAVLPDSDVAGTTEGLVEGWTETDETTYIDGASDEAGYGALTDDEKREANQIVRSRSALNDVFRTFVINPDWDFVGPNSRQVFVDDEDDAARYFPWWNDVTFAPELPLRQGVAYTTVPTLDDDARKEYRTPYVLFERPGEDKFLQAEKMSNREGNPSFSVEVGIGKEGQAITLDVNGSEQHAIAETRFTALPVDYADGGEWDYFDSSFTVALTEDRFAEYAFPDSENLPVRDALRRRVIYAGEAYKLTRDASGTVYDVDVDGAKVVTGTAAAFYDDDRDRLESLGQIAASWFLIPRQILRLVSARPSAIPLVGQIVGWVNVGTPHATLINSVVSEIRVSMPRADSLSASNYSIVTSLGEMNPLAFDPVLVGADAGGAAGGAV